MTDIPLVAPPAKTVAQMLGEIVWLMTQSPPHRQLFLGDLDWFCMPTLLLEQFRIFYGPDSPAAVALWAKVSDEADARLQAGGSRLRADEWNSGEHCWLVELVAPFGGGEEILRDLHATAFGGRPFKFHHIGEDGQRRVSVFDPDTGGAAPA